MNNIDKEDYTKQDCPLCIDNLKNNTNITKIPVLRVIEKLDGYFENNDYSGAERHLLYWKNEAELGFDLRGRFSVLNELMGLYRKTNNEDKAINAVNEMLETVEKLENEESVSAATAYLNAATVYKAFNRLKPSLDLFKKARKIYEKELKDNDYRLGGLYNNYGLTLLDLKEFNKAIDMFNKAISIMKHTENGELEQAITHLNIANTYENMLGLEKAEEKISKELDIAEKLLLSENVAKDGYYAFVCEKCAPTFLYYGRFAFSGDLNQKVKEIYERS